MSSPKITFREYNPATGAFIGNVSFTSFGNVAAGSHSQVKVFDIAFTGVTTVFSVAVGLVNSGGVTVNSAPTGIMTDGSSSNGQFGIMHGQSFDPTVSDGSLTRHFAGLSGGTAPDKNNVQVGTRNDTTSQFIYLDVQPAAANVGNGAVMYMVFFDFS